MTPTTYLSDVTTVSREPGIAVCTLVLLLLLLYIYKNVSTNYCVTVSKVLYNF